MNKFLHLFLVVIIAACTNTPEHSPFQFRKSNNGISYKWHNIYEDKVILDTESPDTNNWKKSLTFCSGAKYKKINVWGRGSEPERIYSPEFLPSFFKRKIVFTNLVPAKGQLWWIFTGDKGGFSILLNDSSICLVQRYYDSFGLNEQKNDSLLIKRYPEKELVFSTIHYTGKLESLTIELNSNNQLILYMNGKQVAEQLCMMDVTQHQIRFSSFESHGDICGEIYEPSIQSVDLSIDESETFQEIIGFGGITSMPAYHQLSDEGKIQWWKFIKEYNLTIQREYPNGSKLNSACTNFDSLEDATAHYYGDNFPNGEISDFEYNKKIIEMGGMIIFEFWQLPSWALISENSVTPLYEKYADAIIQYCKQSKEKTGKAPEIVGIQNEVEQEDSVWQQMTLIVRKALDENGFSHIKIHMHNNSILKGGIHAAKAFSSSDKVWKAIDYSASNLYDYQGYKLNVDAYDTVIAKWNSIIKDKPFISTELCQNDNILQGQSYKTAFFMGQLYHKNMVLMNASSIMYCWLLVNNVQPSFSASRSLFSIDMSDNFMPKPSSFQLRVFGAYSKHIHREMKRMDATTEDRDLLISAYLSKKNKTILLTNRGNEPKRILLNNTFDDMTKGELINQYYSCKSISIKDSIILQPGDIVTLFR